MRNCSYFKPLLYSMLLGTVLRPSGYCDKLSVDVFDIFFGTRIERGCSVFV